MGVPSRLWPAHAAAAASAPETSISVSAGPPIPKVVKSANEGTALGKVRWVKVGNSKKPPAGLVKYFLEFLARLSNSSALLRRVDRAALRRQSRPGVKAPQHNYL